MNIFKSKIFWKIQFLCLFSILFLLGSIFYISNKQLPEISRSHFQEVTDARVINHKNQIDAIINQYYLLGEYVQENVKDATGLEKLSDYLREVTSLSIMIDAGLILDGEGLVSYFYPEDLDVLLYSNYYNQYVEDAITSKEVTVGSGIGEYTNKPYIDITIPIVNEMDDVEHIIYLVNYTENHLVIDSLLSSSELGVGGYSVIVNEAGIIVAHPNPDYIGKMGNSSIVQKLANNESGYDQVVNGEGILFNVSYTPVPSLGWGGYAQIPDESTKKLLNTFEASIWKVALFSLIVLFVMTTLILRRIVRPILHMHDTIGNITIGNDKQKLTISDKNDPETNKLLVRFNEMIDRIDVSRKEIQYQAHHDALTGLPNRYQLEEYLEKAMTNAKINEETIAVLYLDLDRFKVINDMAGHHMGDLLLKEVAERLKKTVPDKSMVARQGGDEFIILVENTNKQGTEKVVQRIIDCLSSPFIISGQEFLTSSSIGISFYPKDGETIESIIQHADNAMFKVKKRGKNNFQFHTSDTRNVLNRKYKLEIGLRKAIKNNELILYYQPQLDLQTNKLRGLEALIRWNHPEFGLVPPNDFIPLAEDTGMINAIGNWVMKEACTQNKVWQKAGFPKVPIAVNVSPIQFRDKNFIQNTKNILEETKLNPQFLEIEITESTMLDFENTIEKLHTIKKMGIKVSIDDFGTGYSSLSTLDRLPIDTLKIDQSFITHLNSNSNKAAIVKTIINLGHNLNFHIVAEGIEQSDQLDVLKEYNCHIGQGYLFNRPLPVEKIEIFYKDLFKQTVKDNN